MSSCAQVIAHGLKEAGGRRVFGLPGGEVLGLVEAFRQEEMPFVLVHHESAAAFMADVTGQLTRCPGVCLSTLGPGATNLVSGVANAYLDRSPVVAITGQINMANLPYATHQRLDLETLFRPITKATVSISPQTCHTKVARAILQATKGRPGPVHLAVPSDVAQSQAEARDPAPSISTSAPEPSPQAIASVVQELKPSKHPLVLVGIGVDAVALKEPVRRFLEKTHIPAMTTPKAKGMVPEDHPLFLGTAGGMAADDLVTEFLRGVDLVLGIGYDPVESDKIWHKDLKIIHLGDYSVADGAYLPFGEVVGDTAQAIEAILEAYSPNHAWCTTELDAFKVQLKAQLTPDGPPSSGLSPYETVLHLRQLLPRDTIVATDVGAHKFLMGQAWAAYEPKTFLVSNGFSSMGYGVPAAMAAKLEHPERPVAAVCGDGGFSLMLHELETAVRLKLGVIMVVFCDNSLSLIQVGQARRGLPRYGVDFGPSNLAAVAEAFNARGVYVDSQAGLEGAIAIGLEGDVPTVIQVSIDPTEYEKQC